MEEFPSKSAHAEYLMSREEVSAEVHLQEIRQIINRIVQQYRSEPEKFEIDLPFVLDVEKEVREYIETIKDEHFPDNHPLQILITNPSDPQKSLKQYEALFTLYKAAGLQKEEVDRGLIAIGSTSKEKLEENTARVALNNIFGHE